MCLLQRGPAARDGRCSPHCVTAPHPAAPLLSHARQHTTSPPAAACLACTHRPCLHLWSALDCLALLGWSGPRVPTCRTVLHTDVRPPRVTAWPNCRGRAACCRADDTNGFQGTVLRAKGRERMRIVASMRIVARPCPLRARCPPRRAEVTRGNVCTKTFVIHTLHRKILLVGEQYTLECCHVPHQR